MQAIIDYLQGSVEELRLVRWPTQQQAIRLSVIVLVFIVANAAAFGLLDVLFNQILRLTIR
ncbi:MAG: preprotein translocase subunit SecE [Candidatus Peribacteraceae bacterium]|nr:preprotein translocase subunit SecE [Candidatus Peribacteraceae bacterium]